MKNKLAILTGVVIVVGFLLLFLAPYRVIETQAYLTVTQSKVGINLDNDAIWFGSIPLGGSAKRPINISSSKNSRVIIRAEGALSDWMIVSENKFRIVSNEKKEVDIYASVPTDAPLGFYNGKLLIYFYRDFRPSK